MRRRRPQWRSTPSTRWFAITRSSTPSGGPTVTFPKGGGASITAAPARVPGRHRGGLDGHAPAEPAPVDGRRAGLTRSSTDERSPQQRSPKEEPMDTIQEHDTRLVVEEWNRTELADEAGDRHRTVRRPGRQVARCHGADRRGGHVTHLRRGPSRGQPPGRHLLGLGLRGEDRCAVYQRRSAKMIVSMFGTLAAGRAYVPIDEGNPPERVEAILRDSGTAVVWPIHHRAEVPAGPVCVVNVDDHPGATRATPGAAAPGRPRLSSCTPSGSTGTPKGVRIERRAVTAFVRGAQHLYGLSPGTASCSSPRSPSTSPPSTPSALLSGAALHVAPVDPHLRRALP